MQSFLINVPDEGDLLQANDDIRSKLNDLSSDVNDILSNISTLSYDVELLDASIVSEIGGFPDLSVPVGKLEVGINLLVNHLSHSITHIFGVLPEFERVVHEVNMGNVSGKMDVELFNFDFSMADVGSWAAELLKNIGSKINLFSAAGFLINYAMNLSNSEDFLKQASDDVSEVTSNEVSEALWTFIVGKVSSSQLVGSAQPLWVNAPVGGIVASIGVGLVDLVTHEGVWEDLDTTRLIADMTSVFGATVVKTAVASFAAAQLGSVIGAAAGPVGALIGGVAGWGVGALIDWASAELIGDVAVDKFIVYKNPDGSLATRTWSKEFEDYMRSTDGLVNVYEVPRNGVGDNGSYDALADVLLRQAEKHYTLGYNECSERYFASNMYSNKWYETAISLGVEEDLLHRDAFNFFINDLMSKNFQSESEFNEYVLKILGRSYDFRESNTFGFLVNQTLNQLTDCTNFTFDLWDYYQHCKKS